jgi:hypothetical protein
MKRAAWYLFVATAVIGTAVAAASCKQTEESSTSDPNKPNEETPKEYFIANVYPRIGGQNACAGCHEKAPSKCSASSCFFIGDTAERTYGLIERTVGYIAAPQKSPLLIYNHKDTEVVADQRSKLTGDQANVLGIWLGMEATARKLPGAVAKARNLQEAYDQFAKCMNFDVFVGTSMSNLPFAQTDFDGPCTGCHAKGQAGIWLAADPTLTFESLKRFPYIQKLVVGRVDAQGNFKDLVPSGRIIDKANEPCPLGAEGCHPPYGLSDQMVNSIQRFVGLTLQNLAAGTCENGIVSNEDAGLPATDGGR